MPPWLSYTTTQQARTDDKAAYAFLHPHILHLLIENVFSFLCFAALCFYFHYALVAHFSIKLRGLVQNDWMRAVYTMTMITNGLLLLSLYTLDETLQSNTYKTWTLMQAIAGCCSLTVLWQQCGEVEGVLLVKLILDATSLAAFACLSVLRSVLEASDLTLVPGKQIILGVCLAFIPVGVHSVCRFWTYRPKHRLYRNQKTSSGAHQWRLMQPLGEANL